MKDIDRTKEELLQELEELRNENILRKKAEEKLKESEERFKKLSSFTFEGILIHNNAIAIDANNSALEMLGYSKEEIDGMNLFSLIHPDSHWIVKENIVKQVATPYQIIAIRKDGSTFDAEIEARNISYNDEYFRVACIRDITTKKEVEEFEQKKVEILKLLNSDYNLDETIYKIVQIINSLNKFDAIGVRLKKNEDFPYFSSLGFSKDFLILENSLIETDLKGDFCRKEDGSPSLECTCGFVLTGDTNSRPDLFTEYGSGFFNDTIPLLSLSKSQDPRNHPRNNCIHQGYMSVGLVPIKIKDDIVGLFQFNSKQKYAFNHTLMNFLESISSLIGLALMRNQALDELKESEEHLKAVYNIIGTGIILINSDSQRIIDANKTATELIELPLEEIIGKAYHTYICPIEIGNYPKKNNDLITNGEKTLLTASGDVKDILNTVYPIKYKGLNCYIDSFMDITKLKAIEKQLRITNEELGISYEAIETNLYQKNALIEELETIKHDLEELNATKDKFFSIIAHDLKGPFNGFLGLTQLMAEQSQYLSIQQVQEFSKTMMYSANNLFKLLENLLQWARMQRGLIEFNPNELAIIYFIEENIYLLEERAKLKEIQFKKNIPDNISVYADMNMLNTILRNLLSNAIKFTPRGGKITIGIETQGSEGHCIIYIKDNGIGMNKDLLKNLFKVEEIVSRPGTDGETSTGLGLILCKEFVDKHGGNIWVDSEEGLGSTFYFTLPVYKEE